nr:hypothetical protein [Tanacetum cinerariifolium]
MNFCDVPIKADSSYGWCKILQMRSTVQRFFFHVLDKGDRIWFNKWHDEEPLDLVISFWVKGPLDLVISLRDVHRGGFDANSKVKDLLRANMWLWPNAWLHKYAVLNSIVHNDAEDKLLRKDMDGKLQSFVVSHVWQAIRPRLELEYWKFLDELRYTHKDD